MLDTVVVRSFKSLENVQLELGVVNVLVGANGSGKSIFLEALGVLSAAAKGTVDDETLLARVCAPGCPSSTSPPSNSHVAKEPCLTFSSPLATAAQSTR